jgi:hypothetical protein
MTAPDVGDPGPPIELRYDAVQRREPCGDQVSCVGGPEEPLGAVEQRVIMLVPPDPAAASERGSDFGLIAGDRHRDLKRAR